MAESHVLSENEVISLDGIPLSIKRINRYAIEPMPKLKQLLDNFVFDLSYLNMCAMRVPLPMKIASNNKFIKALNIEDCPIDEWIASKIFNGINFFRLINEINRIEEENIIQTLDCGKTSSYYENILRKSIYEYKIFNLISHEIKVHLIDQINKMLKGVRSLSKIYDLINL